RRLAGGLRARERLRRALRGLGRRGRGPGCPAAPCRPPLRLAGAARDAAPPLARDAQARRAPPQRTSRGDGVERSSQSSGRPPRARGPPLSEEREVTVVVKTFQRPEALRRLVASIRRFYPDIGLFVVDDSEEPLEPVPPGITRYWHLP